jgi:UDP-2,3-diacylglucosamine pyrophosphatase LpxH
MVVFISDIHLTDGSSGKTIDAVAFRSFRERLRDLTYDASWRHRDGKTWYEPVQELDLVLLGDIFDLIRSEQWPANISDAGYVRPWSDPNSQLFIDKIASITDKILQNNDESIAILKSLQDGKTITLPPATQDGKPQKVSHEPDSADRVPVKVRIHYVVGNHDWFFHLPGDAYNQIRQKVIEALGLCNSKDLPFPYEANESPCLEKTLRDHNVYACHGDKYDSFNFDGKRDCSSLGDAIVIDLISRFPAVVRADLGSELSPACANGLREIDNVRPYALVPAWLDGLLDRYCTQDQTDKVKDIWNKMVDDFLNLAFVRKHDKYWAFDNVDKLKAVLKLSQGSTFHSLQAGVQQAGNWFFELFEKGSLKNAIKELSQQDNSIRYIVFGHTHQVEAIPLDSESKGHIITDKLYFNTGTWRQVQVLTQCEPAKHRFTRYAVLTYITIYTGDERLGQPYETWNGMLGA